MSASTVHAAAARGLAAPVDGVGARRPGGRRVVSVGEPLDALLPRGGLGRGEVVTVTGSTSLGLALLARPSREGAWCAVAGVPALGLASAAEAGVDLARLLLVPRPGARWTEVVAALVDAVDVVVLGLPSRLPTGIGRRLVARVRARKVVLLVLQEAGGPGVEGAAVRLTVTGQRWEGLGDGHGHLRRHHLEVRVEGQRAASRPRTFRVSLPGQGAAPTVVPPGSPLQASPSVSASPGTASAHGEEVAG